MVNDGRWSLTCPRYDVTDLPDWSKHQLALVLSLRSHRAHTSTKSCPSEKVRPAHSPSIGWAYHTTHYSQQTQSSPASTLPASHPLHHERIPDRRAQSSSAISAQSLLTAEFRSSPIPTPKVRKKNFQVSEVDVDELIASSQLHLRGPYREQAEGRSHPPQKHSGTPRGIGVWVVERTATQVIRG